MFGSLLALPSLCSLVEFLRDNPAGAMVAGQIRSAAAGEAAVLALTTLSLLPRALCIGGLAHPMLNVSAGLNIEDIGQ